MVECGICLEEYQEGDLELHRQMCEVRLMFRCSLCDGDYVNKEGLWNHLDLHEIADESKELHYQEIKAKHKLHQCVLCNDQHAFSEISYWKHVHDVHDGFFLRCSDCGENFRSEKLKNDHDSSRCKARHPMEEEQVPIEVGNMTADAERLKLSSGDQSSNTNEGPDNRLSTDYAEENIIDKESELPTINLPSRFPCDICGQSFSSKGLLFRHKAAKYTCIEGRQLNSSSSSSSTQCFHCNKECISARSLRQHIIHRHQPTKCGICGITFKGYSQARYHKKQAHSETQKNIKPRYECVKCTEKFVCITLYKHHANVCDPEQNDSSSQKSSGELILEDRSDPKEAGEYYKINRFKELKYQCPHCGKKFHNQKHYHAHCSFCEQKMYSCKICGRMFKEFYSVKRHNMRFHPDETSFKNIQIHQDKNQMRFHEPRKANFQCPHCSRKFRLKNKFGDHVASCANLKHSCELCGQRFQVRNRVEDHKKRIHLVGGRLTKGKIERTDSDEEQNRNSVEKIDAAQETTVCNICRISFASTDDLMNHKEQVHLETQKDTEPRYECAKCSMKFHYIKRYKSHLNVCDRVQSDLSSHKSSGELIHENKSNLKVTAENPLNDASCTKCSHCGIEGSSAVNLAHHILIHHDPVACDLCGITLSSFSQAQHHMKTKHKDSQLKCPHCSRRFPLTVRLQKHVSKCENKIIPCEFCGTMFENATAVTEHKKWTCHAYNRIKEQEQKNAQTSPGAKTDASIVGDEISLSLVESSLSKTKCFYCYEEFPSPEYLNLHLKTCHELTKCDICGMTVIGLSCHKNHKLKCHQEPKYECRTCGRKFHCKTKYNKHCVGCDHKTYSCKLCGSTFKHLYSVKQHTKRYHPDESNLENIQIIQDPKQVQNIDLKMEITVEETTISARDDQGLSSVNPSSDVLDARSNEQSSAYLSEDEIMDSQVIDNESQTVSVAPLNCSKRQVVSEEISQPLDENISNQPYICNICGITMHRYSQFSYHRATKHKEGRHQCPHCSRKFHFKIRLEEHASCCASLKHSCELCGQKFNLQSRVEDHKKRVHHGSKPLRDANIKGADCNEAKQQDSVEKMDAAEQMTSCIVCRISFASTDELMKHKLNCPKHDDSQFSAEDISLLHGVSEGQADSTIVAQGEIIDVKLEIEVEETLLQEQDFQVPNQNPETSSATTLLPDGDKSKNVESEDVDDLENEIVVKEECLEDEEETIVELRDEHQTGTISNQKLNCATHDDSQFSTEDISLLHGVSEAQADSTIVAEADIIDVKLEIEVEETLLQEHDFQVPNQNPGRSSATTLTGAEVIRHTHLIELGYVPVKSCSFEDAKLFVKDFEFGFGLHSERISKKGSMRYYRCSRIKVRVHPQCQRKVLMFTPNGNEKSTVCVKGEHSCMNDPPKNAAVPAQIDFGYTPVKTCSVENAKSFVKNFEFGFSIMTENEREKGNMRYYRCSRIKQRVRPQCERKVLICTPYANEESTVFVKGEHSCINAAPENLTNAQIDYGYALVKTCSIEDAKSFVKNFEFGFCYRSEKFGKKARMQYYLCSRVKLGARPQCERRVLICTPYTNEESTVHVKGEHSCMNAPPRNLPRAPIGFGYVLVKTCPFEDAKSFVKNFEFGFAFRVAHNREKDNIRYYRCSRIKQRVRLQCKRKVLIFTPDTNEESTVCAKGEHSCIDAPPENLMRVKAKPSVEQADITDKSGVPKKDVRNHAMQLRTSVSKN